MTSSLCRFSESSLRSFTEDILVRVGASAEAARTVADSLVDADRRGINTHGLVRLPSYCADVRAGRIVAGAAPRVERERGATASIDGQLAFGAVTGTVSMDEAVVRAERHGVGVVTARRCNHFGAAAYYALRAVERGLIGVAATNTPAVMAPWGGAEARLGNNPISIAAPLPSGQPPFVLDLAQSAVSRGRIKLAELEGERIPEGWALDPDGRPTTDPAAALAGALLPFGGYKGYGLALAVEVLTSALAGGELSLELINASLTGSARSSAATRVGTVSSLYVALDPDCFGGRTGFSERIGRLTDAVRSTPPAAGFAEVLIPGEPEARSAEVALRRGIGLVESTVELLEVFAASEGVVFPSARG